MLTKDASQFFRLGAHRRTDDVGTEQDIEIEEIISHKDYRKPYGMANDIAMLKLKTTAKLNRAVNLACMPVSSENVADGKMCWVTGRLRAIYSGVKTVFERNAVYNTSPTVLVATRRSKSKCPMQKTFVKQTEGKECDISEFERECQGGGSLPYLRDGGPCRIF